MADNNSFNKISQPTHVNPIQSIQPNKNQLSNPSQSFESYMKSTGSQSVNEKKTIPSLFDLASPKNSVRLTQPTEASILGQMVTTSSVLGDLQNRMNDKTLNLRQSEKSLLRNKLTSTNQNIRAIAKKIGVQSEGPMPVFNTNNPFHKFLALLSDSQTQLSHAQSKIQELNANGVSMNPGDLLLIQVKLTKAQQELEYSSILMSTAVSDIKTLFNIQL